MSQIARQSATPDQAAIDIGWSSATVLAPHALLERIRRQLTIPYGYRGIRQDLMPSREHPRLLYTEGRAGELLIGPGYAQLLATWLPLIGVDVRVQDLRSLPEDLKLAGSTSPDSPLAPALSRNPLGQIEVADTREMIGTIAEIRRLLPHARLYIIVDRRYEARQLAGRLMEALDRPVDCVWSQRPVVSRTVVTTSTYLPNGEGEPAVFLFTNPRSISWQDATPKLQHYLNRSRAYLFRRPGERLDLAERRIADSWFGSVLYRSPTRPAEVVARFAPIRVRTLPKADGDAVDRKRRLIWKNGERNREIAEIARALLDQDLTALNAIGLMIEGGDAQWFTNRSPGLPITIVVENREHAMELKAMLSDWEVCACGHEPEESPGGTRPMIVTMTWAWEHGLNTDLIIRGDGTASGLAFDWHLPLARQIPGGRVYLIDLDDTQDGRARRDAHLRRRAYEKLGWMVDEREPEWPRERDAGDDERDTGEFGAYMGEHAGQKPEGTAKGIESADELTSVTNLSEIPGTVPGSPEDDGNGSVHLPDAGDVINHIQTGPVKIPVYVPHLEPVSLLSGYPDASVCAAMVSYKGTGGSACLHPRTA
ncbi:MAG: hypothetical protein ABSH20_21850 [Tepidisphaeraceae bacterium]|jgi:hypothetical protein